jgi:hypothetical protein
VSQAVQVKWTSTRSVKATGVSPGASVCSVAKGEKSKGRPSLPSRRADCCLICPWSRRPLDFQAAAWRLEGVAQGAGTRHVDGPGMPITPAGEARLVSSPVQRAGAAESGETSFECQRADDGGDPARWTDLPRGLSAKLSANWTCDGRVVVMLAQAPCASSRRRGGDADGTHAHRHTDTRTHGHRH